MPCFLGTPCARGGELREHIPGELREHTGGELVDHFSPVGGEFS